MTIYVIRHADAGSAGEWQGDDRARPLSPSGRQQAERLARALQSEPVDHIASSPYLRCMQTLAPLAAAKKLTLTTASELSVGSGAAKLLTLADRFHVEGLCLCTHADVIDDLLRHLVGRAVVSKAAARNEKAGTWVLTVAGTDVTRALYRPPD